MGAFVTIAVLGQALRMGSIVGAIVWFVGIALLIGVCIAGVAIHFRTSRVVLTAGSVDRSGALVRHRIFSTATADGVLTEFLQPMTASTRLLVLAGPDQRGRRRTMRMTAAVWNDAQLEQIARHVGIRPTSGHLTGAEVERLLPGSMPLWYRRPWLFTTVITIVILLVAVGGVLGFWIATDRPPFDDRRRAEESAAAAPAIVEQHDAVLATIHEAMPGTWDPMDVDYIECEHDNRKGWHRYASIDRLDGDVPTTAQLEALAAELAVYGFDDPAFSPPPDPWLDSLTDDWGVGTRVEISVGDDGAVWAEVVSPCLAG